jgi:cysteine desulfurase family protein (TIGR01976 family)
MMPQLDRRLQSMALDETAISCLREEFPALQQTVGGRPIIFFDSPGGSQVHGSVIEAMQRYLVTMNSNAHGSFSFSHKTDEVTYEARKALADFLNASRPEEIVFGPNMTTLTFRVSQAMGQTLKPGDEVLVTRLDHDANVSPWLALQHAGITVRFVDFDPADCTLDMIGLEQSLNPRTKIVAVGYASNAVGTINDVKTITDMAHQVGAWVFVDAVHYAPHGPIDVTELGCDFLVCSAYKFFGPHLGVLYGRYELLELLPARKVIPAGDSPPEKFETGTNNFEGISGARAAVQYLASVGDTFGTEYKPHFSGLHGRRQCLKAGMAAIRSYETQLCGKFLVGLSEIPGIRVYGICDQGKLEQRVPTVSFTIQGLSPRDVAMRLDNRNIFVWDGHFYAVAALERLGLLHQGGLVRVGLCHYNTPREVEVLLETLAEISSE